MDWKRAIEEERAALGRIVALLCALAVLAERAAGRSPVVRSLVLWVLRQAEAVARDFVCGGPDPATALVPIAPSGNAPLDATRLAISLRALARRLARQLDIQARLLPANCRRIGDDAAASPAGRVPALRDALASLSRLAAFAPGAPHPAPDTS
ncbi:MAG TPA: hypothetical protein VIZ90_08950 [Rhizobiaceae bacterium]